MTDYQLRATALHADGCAAAHDAALDLLENAGVEAQHDDALALLEKAGGRVEEAGIRPP